MPLLIEDAGLSLFYKVVLLGRKWYKFSREKGGRIKNL